MDGDNLSGENIGVLTFTLGAEEYAINIQQVHEICGYGAITTMANMPAYIKGVINLRGVIVTFVDMRIKFNPGTPIYDASTVVILLSSGHGTIGMVVKTVSDINNWPLNKSSRVDNWAR